MGCAASMLRGCTARRAAIVIRSRGHRVGVGEMSPTHVHVFSSRLYSEKSV